MKLIPTLLLALPLAALTAAHAQSAQPKFQSGQWQIDSTVTPSIGKPVHNSVTVCAKGTGDFWKNAHPGQQCSPPQVTSIANGYNIKIQCSGGAGPVQWKMSSSVDETFSADGGSFQATGSTTSETILPGHPPMQVSATMQSSGKRLGACK
jgi:hypothetical protein